MKEIPDNLKLYILEKIEEEREKNKILFAIKLIEKIVFTMVWVMALGILWAVLKLVIIQ